MRNPLMRTDLISAASPQIKIIIAGLGGQGVLLTSRVLAETAMAQGWPAILSEVHGMAQRGGAVTSHLTIGCDQAPLIQRGTADLLIALDRTEAIRNLIFLHPGAAAFVNTPDGVEAQIADQLQRLQIDWISIPADRIASECGAKRGTNIALLGFTAAHSRLQMSRDMMQRALAELAPKNQNENLFVFDQGFQAGSLDFQKHAVSDHTPANPLEGLVLCDSLLQVPLYVAGKSVEEIEEECGQVEILKLNSNENPLGPSQKALEALQHSLEHAHRYPGIAERDLRRKLSRYHNHMLTEKHFLIGNGGTDVLRMVAQGFIFPGRQSVICSLSFPLYALLTTMFGGDTTRVQPRPDFHCDLGAMAEAVTETTSLVWLCSPNNPTGFVLTQTEVDEFMARLPQHVLVVIDEAYQAYVDNPKCVDSLGYVAQGRKVVVVRSFSKTAGLANLRVGYGIAHPVLVEYLMHTVLPFNTGASVMYAAAASLEDREYLESARRLVQQERFAVQEKLSEIGLICLPSQANYLLVVDPPGGASRWVEGLLRHGMVVRLMTGFGLPNAFRLTIGRRADNQEFLQVAAGLFSELGGEKLDAPLADAARDQKG